LRQSYDGKNLPDTNLFILDKRLPDIDGIEVCKHLRAQSATRDIPILMISASRNFGQQASKAGANDHLEKPFQMRELLDLVSKYTSHKLKQYSLVK
jgi:CheY-like chemotaxis protein